MFIKEIKLENFRNYDFAKIELNEKTNIFFGDNAQGKTNILEAIFFAGLGKSFRTNKEKGLIKENKENAKIEIKFTKNNREEKINVEINDKKKFFITLFCLAILVLPVCIVDHAQIKRFCLSVSARFLCTLAQSHVYKLSDKTLIKGFTSAVNLI